MPRLPRLIALAFTGACISVASSGAITVAVGDPAFGPAHLAAIFAASIGLPFGLWLMFASLEECDHELQRIAIRRRRARWGRSR